MATAAVLLGATSGCQLSFSATDRASKTAVNCFDSGPIAGAGTTPESVNPALWKQVFVDTFDRCALGDQWSTYAGQPGGNPVGTWDDSMVSLDDGVLSLTGKKTDGAWVTGGVSNYPVTQTYGRWEVRMRATRSADLSYHMLLWPKDEQWPPEIDFAESVSAYRDAMSAFVHWKADGENKKANASTTGLFDTWHTVGVEWLPGLIRYLLDGKVWAEVRDSAMVPTVPMWLGMQMEAGACERRADWGMEPCADSDPRPSRATVDIDWVAVYSPVDDEDAFAEAGYLSPTPGAIQIGES